MTNTTTEARMPAFWASYLINGDASGMTADERTACDAYLEKEGIVDVLDCEDEAHFSWSFDLHGGDCAGGDLLRYTIVTA